MLIYHGVLHIPSTIILQNGRDVPVPIEAERQQIGRKHDAAELVDATYGSDLRRI